jgi:hypothetical protein
MMDVNGPLDAPVEHRASGRLARMWWTISRRNRIARFNRWRKTPRIVTRGFLLFRDLVLIGFVLAIVLAGVATVRNLRAEDCRAANARRAETKQVALDLVGNDKFFVDFIDSFIPDGLPATFKDPLLNRYQQQLNQIETAYRPIPCPGDELPQG